jgi:hypothetical protein
MTFTCIMEKAETIRIIIGEVRTLVGLLAKQLTRREPMVTGIIEPLETSAGSNPSFPVNNLAASGDTVIIVSRRRHADEVVPVWDNSKFRRPSLPRDTFAVGRAVVVNNSLAIMLWKKPTPIESGVQTTFTAAILLRAPTTMIIPFKVATRVPFFRSIGSALVLDLNIHN